MPKQKTPVQIVAFHQRQIKLANSLPEDVYLRILKEDGLTITINQKPYSFKLPEAFDKCSWSFKSPYSESHVIHGHIRRYDNKAEVTSYIGTPDDSYRHKWSGSPVTAFSNSLKVDEFSAADYILRKAASYCNTIVGGGSDGTTG